MVARKDDLLFQLQEKGYAAFCRLTECYFFWYKKAVGNFYTPNEKTLKNKNKGTVNVLYLKP